MWQSLAPAYLCLYPKVRARSTCLGGWWCQQGIPFCFFFFCHLSPLIEGTFSGRTLPVICVCFGDWGTNCTSSEPHKLANPTGWGLSQLVNRLKFLAHCNNNYVCNRNQQRRGPVPWRRQSGDKKKKKIEMKKTCVDWERLVYEKDNGWRTLHRLTQQVRGRCQAGLQLTPLEFLMASCSNRTSTAQLA